MDAQQLKLVGRIHCRTGRYFRCIATATAKYWICKRGPAQAYEALECLGGNGYVEDFPLARRYREQPVLAVWEGSGNVIVLDVLRVLGRDPRAVKQLTVLFENAPGHHDLYDARYDALNLELQEALAAVNSADATMMAKLQRRGRVLVEHLALMLQAAGLIQHALREVAASVVAARLDADGGKEYGAIPDAVEIDALLSRA